MLDVARVVDAATQLALLALIVNTDAERFLLSRALRVHEVGLLLVMLVVHVSRAIMLLIGRRTRGRAAGRCVISNAAAAASIARVTMESAVRWIVEWKRAPRTGEGDQAVQHSRRNRQAVDPSAVADPRGLESPG